MPLCIEKVRDFAGLHPASLGWSAELCLDENGQIQALDGTRPVLAPGTVSRSALTHAYRRNRSTTLVAALNTAPQEVTGERYHKHRSAECPKFRALI